MNSRTTIQIAAALGAVAVGLGAFGAHAWKPMLIAAGRLDTFQTGVSYNFYHVFALLATGILMTIKPSKKLAYAAWCFFVGIILFSGSLYVLCLTSVTKFGIVTPFGGVFFIAGWILVLFAFTGKETK